MDKQILTLTPTICSYFADITETKALTEVLNGNPSCKNAHRSLCIPKTFKRSSDESKKCLNLTRMYIAKLNASVKEVARLESLGNKGDAAIRKERIFSLLCKNSFESY